MPQRFSSLPLASRVSDASSPAGACKIRRCKCILLMVTVSVKGSVLEQRLHATVNLVAFCHVLGSILAGLLTVDKEAVRIKITNTGEVTY